EPAWMTYAKHLSPAWARWIVPVAVSGMVVLLWRHRTRRLWAPMILFTLVFFYVLSTHSHVFGRYALPLVPPLCIFTAVAAAELVRALRRVPALSGAIASRIVWTAIVVLMLWSSGSATVQWLEGLKRADTRSMAADWLKSSVPHG